MAALLPFLTVPHCSLFQMCVPKEPLSETCSVIEKGYSTISIELSVLLSIMFNIVSLDFEVMLLGTYIYYTFLMK